MKNDDRRHYNYFAIWMQIDGWQLECFFDDLGLANTALVWIPWVCICSIWLKAGQRAGCVLQECVGVVRYKQTSIAERAQSKWPSIDSIFLRAVSTWSKRTKPRRVWGRWLPVVDTSSIESTLWMFRLFKKQRSIAIALNREAQSHCPLIHR